MNVPNIPSRHLYKGNAAHRDICFLKIPKRLPNCPGMPDVLLTFFPLLSVLYAPLFVNPNFIFFATIILFPHSSLCRLFLQTLYNMLQFCKKCDMLYIALLGKKGAALILKQVLNCLVLAVTTMRKAT